MTWGLPSDYLWGEEAEGLCQCLGTCGGCWRWAAPDKGGHGQKLVELNLKKFASGSATLPQQPQRAEEPNEHPLPHSW